LDGLCGIYAIINATRIIKKLKTKDSYKLFSDCLNLLEKKHKRLSPYLCEGLSSRDLSCILRYVCEKYFISRFKPFHKRSYVPLPEFWKKTKSFLKEKQRQVIMSYESWDFSHWTVINGATDKSLFLYDSDGNKRLYRNRCTTAEITTHRPILLDPQSSYFLSN